MLKIIFFVSVLLLFAESPIYGADDWHTFDPEKASFTDAFECKKAQSADNLDDLLSRVQEQYDRVEFYSADFVQYSYLMALDAQEQSSGNVWFQKPGMMKWLYLQPEEQVFLFRDNTFWYYQAFERQLFIDKMKAAFQSDLPLSFLMGLGSLKDNFKVKSGCSNQKGVLLTLAPRDSTSDDKLSEFKLLVHPQTSFPIGAMIVEVSQNSTAILLENVSQTLPQKPNEIFTADFPEDLDVQDNRADKES